MKNESWDVADHEKAFFSDENVVPVDWPAL